MKNIQASFRDQIQDYETVKTEMSRKLNISVIKEVKIKQLQMENENLNNKLSNLQVKLAQSNLDKFNLKISINSIIEKKLEKDYSRKYMNEKFDN